ncbi:MAG: phosphoserine transaminase [Pseudomonadota bacterium]
MSKPTVKPKNPFFSSGPCAKRPGWALDALKDGLLGRSHRSGPGKAKLKEVIDRHRAVLGIPDDYRIMITAASDTGAFEMAMWNLLGARGVDVLAWESFSGDWLKDVKSQLKLTDVNYYEADYGDIVDLDKVDSDRDVVFAWNGTTSGVRVPNGDWIKDDRQGLTLADSTSAVFAYDMPWDKLDAVTWSWQKVLGSEGAHGMLVLSPRAVERISTYKPDWPLPKFFRIAKGEGVNEAAFQGATLNTPSMLAVEDCLDALKWVESIGGLSETIKRSESSYNHVVDWVAKTDWVEFLPTDPAIHSYTSICLKIVDPAFEALDDAARGAFVKSMCKLLEAENAAFDVNAYRDAPAGLRLWGGATVDPADMEALLPWLDWAFAEVKAEHAQKAA